MAFCAPEAMAPRIDWPAASPEPDTDCSTASSCWARPSMIGFATAAARAAQASTAVWPALTAAAAMAKPALPTLMAMSAAARRPFLIPFTVPESGVPSASGIVLTESSTAALTASNASAACLMASVAMLVTHSAASWALERHSRARSPVAAEVSCAASPALADACAT